MSNEIKKELKVNDISIIQDTKILQQIFKELPNGVKNQVNVIMINQVDTNPEGNFNFSKFLEALPEPRLDNLIDLAYRTAYQKYHKGFKAANFLGLSRQGFAKHFRKLKEADLVGKLFEIEDKKGEEEN